MLKLLTPIKIGDLELKNRVFMAPLTRDRSLEGGMPQEINEIYYEQRSSAGLIITEATPINPFGIGYVTVPCIYNQEQIEAWKKVTTRVHQAGGRIFCQLWHVGRISHPDHLNGELPLAPSAINPNVRNRTPQGSKETVTPKAMTIAEIESTIIDYGIAAKNAIEAGFDGVEIHGANGYLIDQFICDGSNQRADEYGGSIENRAKFLFKVVEEVIKQIGKSRVGLRLSPSGAGNGIFNSNPVTDFEYIINELNKYELAYLHLMQAFPGFDTIKFPQYLLEPVQHFRKIYKGTLIANVSFTRESGEKALQEGWADAIVFGKLFIANPDLPKRFELNAPLNEWDASTFYTYGEKGYIDYPFLSEN